MRHLPLKGLLLGLLAASVAGQSAAAKTDTRAAVAAPDIIEVGREN